MCGCVYISYMLTNYYFLKVIGTSVCRMKVLMAVIVVSLLLLWVSASVKAYTPVEHLVSPVKLSYLDMVPFHKAPKFPMPCLYLAFRLEVTKRSMYLTKCAQVSLLFYAQMYVVAL